MRALLAALAGLLLLAPVASAHGDMEINELETLAIADFEGLEDSFPWGGFEIWNVYVGEGYNETLGSDGVYFKVNLAGDGTKRAPGQQAWTVAFHFAVGEETFDRQFTHDGSTITTDFESLQWMVADGNVLQVKAWTPLANATGKSVKDVTLVSSVDGDARDTAPGGVHAPAAGAEIPVNVPATPVFPEMGEGRKVDEVPLTGPGKFFETSITPAGAGSFAIVVKNVLAEQGQHVIFRPQITDGWNVSLPDWGLNLKGGESGAFNATLRPDAPAGTQVVPLRIDLVTDIGGRRTFFAFLENGEVKLVPEGEPAVAASIPAPPLEAPAPALFAALALSGAAVAVGASRRP